MADNVNIVRLSTGEEIVCQMSIVENGSQISYVIKDAAILLPNPNDGRLMFGRWLPYTKNENGITVDSKFVMFIVEKLFLWLFVCSCCGWSLLGLFG